MPKQSNFDKLRKALPKLTLEQARQLYSELGSILQDLERQAAAPQLTRTKGREVVEVRHVSKLEGADATTHLYQLERIRCGKAGCKCAGEKGELHGPYWYAYWRENGRLKSRYVGKQLKPIE